VYFFCSTINGILAMHSFTTQFATDFIDSKTKEPGISPGQSSLIVAMLSAGAVVGALFAAPVGDFFGRRLSLIGSIGVFSFGVIFQVCAVSIPWLLVGRYVLSPAPRDV
jgi:MFS family permease